MLDDFCLALARSLEALAARVEPAPSRDPDFALDLAELLVAAADPAPSVTLARVAGRLLVIRGAAAAPEVIATPQPPAQPEDAERAHLLRAVAALGAGQ